MDWRRFRIVERWHNRRGEDTRTRRIEFCPAWVVRDGEKRTALLEDLTEKGARFWSDDPHCFTVSVGDELTVDVKTPYGMSHCKGTVTWAECAREKNGSGWGVSFTELSDDPKDPLRLMIDSGFC
jgi:hypothetical protein